MENTKFKGTKGHWTRYTSHIANSNDVIKHSVYTGTSRIALCYDFFENDKSKNVLASEAKFNALLISKAPEMLEMLQLVVNDLEERGRAYGDIYTMTKQLIKEATNI